MNVSYPIFSKMKQTNHCVRYVHLVHVSYHCILVEHLSTTTLTVHFLRWYLKFVGPTCYPVSGPPLFHAQDVHFSMCESVC